MKKVWYNIKAVQQWPVGQAVKTLASHAENMGSIPVRVTRTTPPKLGGVFSFWWLVRSSNPKRHSRLVRIPPTAEYSVARAKRPLRTNRIV